MYCLIERPNRVWAVSSVSNSERSDSYTRTVKTKSCCAYSGQNSLMLPNFFVFIFIHASSFSVFINWLYRYILHELLSPSWLKWVYLVKTRTRPSHSPDPTVPLWDGVFQGANTAWESSGGWKKGLDIHNQDSDLCLHQRSGAAERTWSQNPKSFTCSQYGWNCINPLLLFQPWIPKKLIEIVFYLPAKLLMCAMILLVPPAPCLPLVLCWKGQCPWNFLKVNVVFLEAELCTLHLFSLFLIQKHHRNSLLAPQEIICKLFLIYMASRYSSPAAWSFSSGLISYWNVYTCYHLCVYSRQSRAVGRE